MIYTPYPSTWKSADVSWESYLDWIFPNRSNESIDLVTFIHLKCYPNMGAVENKDERFYRKLNCGRCGSDLPDMLRLEYIERIM